MNKNEFGRMIAEVKDLPLLPQVVIMVQRTIDEEDSSAHDLSEAISNDQVLTSRILKLANSSFYRFSHKSISTITEAIVLLGFETIKNITLGLSVYKLLSGFNKENTFHFFWRHSLCCAMAAQSLAEQKNMRVKEASFVAGLLHDIGKVILAHYFPDHYKRVLKALQTDPTLTFSAVEKKIIGIDHKEAGSILASYWNLPLDVAQPIEFHDHPKIPSDSTEISPFHHIIYIANHIAINLYGSDTEKEKYTFSLLSKEAKRFLKIDSDSLFKIINRLSEQVYETARLLDITIDDIRIEKKSENNVEQEQILVLSKNLNRREKELELFMTINKSILELDDVRDIVTVATTGLTKICSPKRLIFAFSDSVNNSVSAKLGYGDVNDELLNKIVIPLKNEDDLITRCINENIHINTTQYSENVLAHLSNQCVFDTLETHRLALFPLKIKNDVKGVMIFEPTKNEILDELSESFLSTFCDSIAIAFSKHGWKN